MSNVNPTTKGSIAVGRGGGYTVLPAGSDGQELAADSFSPSGLKWVSAAGDTPIGELGTPAPNVVNTVISTIATYTLVNLAAYTLSSAIHFDMPSPGRLRYTGVSTLIFQCGCTISCSSAGPNDVTRAVLYKNGVTNLNNEFTGGIQLSQGIIEQKLGGAGDVTSSAIHVFTTLANNDYIELGIANQTAVSALLVKFSNISAIGISIAPP